MTHEYETIRRIVVDAPEEIEGATFCPVCPNCGRFVKAHKAITFKGHQPHGPNADCKKCGPVQMPFEGFM